jgi:CheY-like chemotaxis protein
MADILPFRKPDPHILIVEDDDTTLDVFVEFVQMRITKRVRGMRNAWSAIDYLNACRPIDLVLTDINLYFGRTDVVGMDGIELTGVIKRNWDIPVIVMTGYKPELQKPVALAAGASLFVAKPLPLIKLEAAIYQLLDQGLGVGRSGSNGQKACPPRDLKKKGPHSK